MFDLARAIAGLITGLYAVREGKELADKYLRAGLSLFGTAYVSFWGTWGIAIWALYPKVGTWAALVLGFGSACTTMAVMVLVLWKRSEAFRGISIAVPMEIERKVLEQDVSITTPAKE